MIEAIITIIFIGVVFAAMKKEYEKKNKGNNSKLRSKRKQAPQIKTYHVNGIMCQGTWEKQFVEYCLANNFPVKRYDEKPLPYEFKGKTLNYYPDFIVERNGGKVIIEVKGHMNEKARAKYRKYHEDVLWLFKEYLQDMGVFNLQNKLDKKSKYAEKSKLQYELKNDTIKDKYLVKGMAMLLFLAVVIYSIYNN